MYYTTICVHDAVEFFFNNLTTHFIQKKKLMGYHLFYCELLYKLIKLFECDLKLYILLETAYIYVHVKHQCTP